jgi:hypothetical protein
MEPWHGAELQCSVPARLTSTVHWSIVVHRTLDLKDVHVLQSSPYLTSRYYVLVACACSPEFTT